jgi:beta-glucosidase
MAIFNRGDVKADKPTDKRRAANTAANKILATANTSDDHVVFLDINDKFPPVDSPDFATIFPGLLHPNTKGYEIWADALKPYILQYIGAPAATPTTTP